MRQTLNIKDFKIQIYNLPFEQLPILISPTGKQFRQSGVEQLGFNEWKYTFRYLDGGFFGFIFSTDGRFIRKD